MEVTIQRLALGISSHKMVTITPVCPMMLPIASVISMRKNSTANSCIYHVRIKALNNAKLNIVS